MSNFESNLCPRHLLTPRAILALVWLAGVPGCTAFAPRPASTVSNDYEAKVAELRAGGDACDHWLWVSAGSCEELLIITETTGYSGQVSYFDSATGGLIHVQDVSDVDFASPPDGFHCENQNVIEVFCTEDVNQ